MIWVARLVTINLSLVNRFHSDGCWYNKYESVLFVFWWVAGQNFYEIMNIPAPDFFYLKKQISSDPDEIQPYVCAKVLVHQWVKAKLKQTFTTAMMSLGEHW